MGKRAITPELYKEILAAYRKNPGNHSAVARAVGCDSRTATKAWFVGLRIGNRGSFPPIKDQVMAEQVTDREARAQVDAQELPRAQARAAAILAEAEQKAKAMLDRAADASETQMRSLLDRVAELKAKAELEARSKVEAAEAEVRRRSAVIDAGRMDAAEQAAREVLLSRAGMNNATGLHGMVATTLQRIARPLSEQLINWVTTGQATPMQAQKMLQTLSRAVRDATIAGRTAIQVERIRVGDPTEIIGVQLEPESFEEAERTISHAAECLELVRRRRRSNGGGLADPHPSSGNPPADGGNGVPN